MGTTISDLLEAGAELIGEEAEGRVSAAGAGSCVARLVYDYSTQVLTIDFVKGGSHEYSGVPADVVAGLLTADSQGAYFNINIRNSY